jgi:hypothetical protein
MPAAHALIFESTATSSTSTASLSRKFWTCTSAGRVARGRRRAEAAERGAV